MSMTQAEADAVKTKRTAVYDSHIAMLQTNPQSQTRDDAIADLQAHKAALTADVNEPIDQLVLDALTAS